MTNQVNWAAIPDIILEEIFLNLSFSDRFNASLVCQNWSQRFHSSRLWYRLIIDDRLFSKCPKIQIDDDIPSPNPILDYSRAHRYLQAVGHNIRSISIQITHNFDLLFQFLTLFEWFIVQKLSGNIDWKPLVREFIYKFSESDESSAIFPNPNRIKYFGIGGQIMATVKNVLSRLININTLILTDLALERYEANHFMDRISSTLNKTIKELSLINLTSVHCPLNQLEMFSSLETLILSPQNIDERFIKSIANSNLMDFYIVQNENTPKTILSCEEEAWIGFRVMNTVTRIHLCAAGSNGTDVELLIQPKAPVYSVTCSNLRRSYVREITQNYSDTLVIYLEKTSNVLSNCDNDFIGMAMRCKHLTTMTTTECLKR